jgi:hypothetical protein
MCDENLKGFKGRIKLHHVPFAFFQDAHSASEAEKQLNEEFHFDLLSKKAKICHERSLLNRWII